MHFARFFVGCDKRAKKICRNAPAAAADTRRGPGDCLPKNILAAEYGSEPSRQREREFHRHIEIGRAIQFVQGQPDLRFQRAQNFGSKIEKCGDGQNGDRQREQRIVMNECEPAEHGGVFTEAERDIRKWFRGRVAGQARGRFCCVRDQTRSASEQRYDDCEGRARVTQHLNREQGAANRTDHGVNCVPGGIDPGNFVGDKFEKIKDAGDNDNRRMAEYFERLIGRRERDPVEMNRQTGRENREVEVDPRQRSKAERDAEKAELFHPEIICASASMSRGFNPRHPERPGRSWCLSNAEHPRRVAGSLAVFAARDDSALLE